MNDWSARIEALMDAGWSITEIAANLGLTASSVSDIKTKRTTEPRGMAAVKLHRLCPDAPDGSLRPMAPFKRKKAA